VIARASAGAPSQPGPHRTFVHWRLTDLYLVV